ncbi:MAG: arylesterase [Gemmatimonadaceae bacterium]
MRLFVNVIAAIVLISACRGEEERVPVSGTNDTATVDTAVPREQRLLFVGTSLTAGLGLEPEEAYPARIAQRIDSLGLPYRVDNAGYSGETSAGALRRIDWLIREPVDVLVLETGANDGLRGLSVDSMRANIQAIIDRVRAASPNVRILLVGMEAPPNLGPRYTSEFRKVFPELAERNDATLVPFLLVGVAAVDSLNQGDGIHPNAVGSRLLAETVWGALLPLLREAGSSGGTA